MVGARTEAGPTGAVRMVGEVGTRTRAVRMGAAGLIARAEVVGDILAPAGRAEAGACLVEAAGAVVDLAEGDRVRHRWRGQVAGDRATPVADMAVGTAVLRGRRAGIPPGLKAVELTGDLGMVTAEAMVVTTLATVGPAIRTAATVPPVDGGMATAETPAATTATMAGREVAVLTGTHTEIRATHAVDMERRRIGEIPATPG